MPVTKALPTERRLGHILKHRFSMNLGHHLRCTRGWGNGRCWWIKSEAGNYAWAKGGRVRGWHSKPNKCKGKG